MADRYYTDPEYRKVVDDYLTGPRKFSKSEEDYRKFQKKSIVANRNLNKMRKLRTGDITFLRSPNIGIQPIDLKKILGKKLKKNINKYSTILFKDLY